MAAEQLFDLIVNRAADRLGSGPRSDLAEVLAWQSRNRLASHLPADQIYAALRARPASGGRWEGGPEGRWVESSAGARRGAQ